MFAGQRSCSGILRRCEPSGACCRDQRNARARASTKERPRLVPGWKGPFRDTHPIRHGDGLRMLCDGHGCRRRDNPHALTFRPTNGRLARSPKRFEVGRRRTPEQILAEGFHCSCNSLRTLSDNVKCGGLHSSG